MKIRMSAARTAVSLAAVTVSVCVVPGAASAQSIAPTYIGMTAQDVGVTDRPRPAYDAKGVPLDGFRLFPGISVSSTYDDNIFRTANAVDDFFFTTSPSLRLRSDWGRHAFEVYAGLSEYDYLDNTAQNLIDWKVGTDGRYDISRSANTKVNLYYGEMHELWSAPNNTTGYQAAPNRYFQTHADVQTVYQPNRLGFGFGGSFDNYNWTTTPAIGGAILYNDDRDQNEYQAYAKTYYDFSPGYSGYLKVSYDERDFDLFFDRSGNHRSSHGYRVDGGVNLQISHLLAGEIYVGYLQQFYAQNIPTPLKNLSGFDFGAELDYFVAPVLTLHLTAKRTLDDVVLSGVSSADNKNIGISADYEFRPNVILQARGSYTDVRYVGSTRTDSYLGAGVGAKYLVNRYATFNVNYYYSNRATDSASLKYTDNTLSVGLQLHI